MTIRGKKNIVYEVTSLSHLNTLLNERLISLATHKKVLELLAQFERVAARLSSVRV